MRFEQIAARLGLFLLTIFAAVSVNFLILHLSPQDPVATVLGRLASKGVTVEGGAQVIAFYRQQFALDEPLYIQYLLYLRNLLLYGDLGYSLAYFPATVSSVILGALPWTLGLMAAATLLAFLAGNLLGALVAWRPDSLALKITALVAMSFSAVPFYLLALVLLYLFAFLWPVFPMGGTFSLGSARGFSLATVVEVVQHAALPVISLALGLIGFWALGMRGAMTSVLGESYVTYARLKGLSDRTVFLRYGVRNALLPQVTYLAIDFGRLVSGQILVETLFNYPGLGTVLYNALRTADYFVVQGVVLFIILAVATAMLLVDLAYPLIDPRVRTRRAA